jgi:hypothetical protein
MKLTPEDDVKRKREIAELLVAAETNCPGIIRVRPNAGRISVAVQLLAEIGYRKPFLASGRQFAIDSFLTYPDACDCLLTYSFLICEDDERRHHIWNGYGVYKKWFGMLPRFEGHEPIIFAVNIQPVFLLLADVLEPNSTWEAEQQAKIVDSLRELFTKNPPPKVTDQ